VVSKENDPYMEEPQRDPEIVALAHKDRPFNTETPVHTLIENYLTPASHWFVRHHHPVPAIDEEDFELDISLVKSSSLETLAASRTAATAPPPSVGAACTKTFQHDQRYDVVPGSAGSQVADIDQPDDDTKYTYEGQLTLAALRDTTRFPRAEVTATLQCAGNRRAELDSVALTQGLKWAFGAISTAHFEGVWLRDVLKELGIGSEEEARQKGVRWVQFGGSDSPYDASIPIEKALDPRGDVILALKMNGEVLDREHGYPLRVIVPGFLGARSVKWLNSIVAAPEEAYSTWQRGVAYKSFNSTETVEGFENVQAHDAYSVMELPVQSAIYSPSPSTIKLSHEQGSIPVSGFAWSGGGRNITRVDVSADGGQTWTRAELGQGALQPYGRAWAWTKWSVDVPLPQETIKKLHERSRWPFAPRQAHGLEVQLVCKAVDTSMNQQPESLPSIWSLRGIMNNSWHRVKLDLQHIHED